MSNSTGETKSTTEPTDVRFELLEMIDSVKEKLTDNEYKLMVEKLRTLPANTKEEHMDKYECTVLAPRITNLGSKRRPVWDHDTFTYKCRVWLTRIERKMMCISFDTIVSKHIIDINPHYSSIHFHTTSNDNIVVAFHAKATFERLTRLFIPAIGATAHNMNKRSFKVAVQVLDIRRVEE